MQYQFLIDSVNGKDNGIFEEYSIPLMNSIYGDLISKENDCNKANHSKDILSFSGLLSYFKTRMQLLSRLKDAARKEADRQINFILDTEGVTIEEISDMDAFCVDADSLEDGLERVLNAERRINDKLKLNGLGQRVMGGADRKHIELSINKKFNPLY